MLASSNLPAPSLVPLMRYRDVSAAIDWLCTALGFEKQVAVSDPDGGVYYAQLTYGTSLIMLGSVRDTELDKLMRQPDEVGGVETQSCYLVIEDADAHYARATAAGAEIVLDIKSDGLGRRGYSCKDPEGHIWNFGTYNPWKGPSAPATESESEPERSGVRRSAIAAMLTVLVVAALGAAWWITGVDLREYAELNPPAPRQVTRTAPDAKPVVTDEALRESVAGLRAAKEAAEFAAEAARKDLSDAQAARTAAETAAQSARSDNERERAAKDAALRTIQELEAKLTVERSAKDAAGRTAIDAKLAFEKERMAREALERAAREAKERSQKSSENTAPAGNPGPDKGAQIETSATQPATAKASEPKKPTWTIASEGSTTTTKAKLSTASKSRASRKRVVAQAPAVPRFKPTYITDLQDVPWPYNVWFKK